MIYPPTISRVPTHSVAESLPRVKQYLSTQTLIEQVVGGLSLIQPDDPVNKAGFLAYFSEDVLPSCQQTEYKRKDRSNGTTSKVKRYVLSVQRSTRDRERVVLMHPNGCYDTKRTHEIKSKRYRGGFPYRL